MKKHIFFQSTCLFSSLIFNSPVGTSRAVEEVASYHRVVDPTYCHPTQVMQPSSPPPSTELA
ncbi:hypothetical protein V6Z11_D05G033200 [Gossypium hirsutum]